MDYGANQTASASSAAVPANPGILDTINSLVGQASFLRECARGRYERIFGTLPTPLEANNGGAGKLERAPTADQQLELIRQSLCDAERFGNMLDQRL